ncbi:hypothetical protein PFISCL1PPCAC_24194, partial [Pristionchus fissidentatus]
STMLQGLFNLLNPLRWFGTRRHATLAIASPDPPADFAMEIQQTPEPTPPPVEPIKEISTASSYFSAKESRSPSRSESASPKRVIRCSDVEEVMDEEEKKLHELSDGDSSSDEDSSHDQSTSSRSQLQTPPTNLRRTSLVLKKRRRVSESSDDLESVMGTKRTKKSNQTTSSSRRSSPASSKKSMESAEVVVSVPKRVSTNKNRKMSITKKEKKIENDTPTSSRAAVIKKEKEDEKDTPNSSRSVAVRKEHFSKDSAFASPIAKIRANVRKEKAAEAPSSSNVVKTPKLSRTLTPHPIRARAKEMTPAPLGSRPQRACRAMTCSPSRYRETSVTPLKNLKKA